MPSTTTTMVANNEFLLNSAEWPSLGAGNSNRGPSLRSKEAPASDNDWELLQQGDEEADPSGADATTTQEFCNQNKLVIVDHVNPKFLRHSASSPDLRRFALHDIDEDDNDDFADGDLTTDAEASSYAMIAGPGSVVSFSSSAASSAFPAGISFRDAILARHNKQLAAHEEDGDGSSSQPRPAPPPPGIRRPRARARYVVRPIRRCSKSTGDLQSLAEGPEGDDDHEVLGYTDASDFYHRKALGAKGRANGLKIRPDELKRKQFTLQRKELQRQQVQR